MGAIKIQEIYDSFSLTFLFGFIEASTPRMAETKTNLFDSSSFSAFILNRGSFNVRAV